MGAAWRSLHNHWRVHGSIGRLLSAMDRFSVKKIKCDVNLFSCKKNAN